MLSIVIYRFDDGNRLLYIGQFALAVAAGWDAYGKQAVHVSRPYRAVLPPESGHVADAEWLIWVNEHGLDKMKPDEDEPSA